MRIDTPPDSGYTGIVLRPLERQHLAAWFAYLSRPEVFEPTSWNLHSENDLLPLFDSYESTHSGSPRRLALIDQDSGALAGTIGFHTISELNRSAEVAYDLAPAYWGRGIASAVCRALVDWSFGEYGYVRVQGTVLETNLASEQVLRKTGLHYEGLLRGYRQVRGRPGNFKMYARLNID